MQQQFKIAITIVESGENYEAAFQAALATAQRLHDDMGNYGPATLVVTDGDGAYLGGPDGVFCEGCEDCAFPGIRWPSAIGSDSTHEWVERCDTCQRFEGDDAAREWLVENYGPDTIASDFVVGNAIPIGLSAEHPYLDPLH